VRTTDATNEPRQPNLLEKKKNIRAPAEERKAGRIGVRSCVGRTPLGEEDSGRQRVTMQLSRRR